MISQEDKRKLNSLMMFVESTQIFEFDCDLHEKLTPQDISQEKNLTPAQKQNLKQLRNNLIKATTTYYNVQLENKFKVFTTNKIQLSDFGYLFKKSKSAYYRPEFIWFCVIRENSTPEKLKYLAVSSTGTKMIEMSQDFFFDYLQTQATKGQDKNLINQLFKTQIGLLEIKNALSAQVEKSKLQEQLKTLKKMDKVKAIKI